MDLLIRDLEDQCFREKGGKYSGVQEKHLNTAF
jgi:hypothetical protein